MSHRTTLNSWAADKNLAMFWSIWHCESAISFINCWKSKVRPAISNINKNKKWEVSNWMQLPPSFYMVALCILRMKQFYLQRDLCITLVVKCWSTAWGPCRWGQRDSRIEARMFCLIRSTCPFAMDAVLFKMELYEPGCVQWLFVLTLKGNGDWK